MTAADASIQTHDRNQPSAGDAASARSNEPVAALPTIALLMSVVAGGMLATAMWVAGLNAMVAHAPLWPNAAAGIALTVVIYLLTVLMMTPWKQRRMGDWMTFWLAATVVRLLGTPLAMILLYSAALTDLRALGLSVALSYVLCLFLETGTLAWSVNQRLNRADDPTFAPSAAPRREAEH